jgi:hypothetical protein
MATMADNVPAVQALGQCIFLPMLIIGGVAVPLASLPDWAQHLSAFFPGRYAVQALQACVNAGGLSSVRFDLMALTIIGLAGCIAGAMMFRWDAQQRFAMRGRSGWLLVPLAAWAAVGVLSEVSHRVTTTPRPTTTFARGTRADTPLPAPTASAEAVPSPSTGAQVGVQEPKPAIPDKTASRETPPAASGSSKPGPSSGAREGRRSEAGTRTAPPARVQNPAAAKPPPPPQPAPEREVAGSAPAPAPPVRQLIAPSWQAVSRADIDRDLVFDRLPPDGGIVAPIAPGDEDPPPEVLQQLDAIVTALPKWGPAHVQDPVQRARNVLYIAGVPDVWQTELERYAPAIIFDQLEQDIPKDDLIKVLYWIALHPMDGDDTAIEQLPALGFESRAVDVEQARERVALYAVKLLGRLVGAIKSR